MPNERLMASSTHPPKVHKTQIFIDYQKAIRDYDESRDRKPEDIFSPLNDERIVRNDLGVVDYVAAVKAFDKVMLAMELEKIFD